VEGTDEGHYYRGEVTGATDAQRAEVAARQAAAEADGDATDEDAAQQQGAEAS
jgi:hypothetical protein